MRLRLAVLATVLLCCAPAALHAASLSYHRLDASIAYAFAPSANPQPRVLVIGDKLVEDGTKQNNGWVSQLKGAYGDTVELYSLGSNLAHTEAADTALASLLASPQGKAAFSKVVLVVLAFGSNEVNAAHSKTQAPWVSPPAFEQHLGSMVRQLQAQGVEKLILVQPPPLKDPSEALPYAQAVSDVAKTYQVPLVDTVAAISKTPAWKTEAFNSAGQLAQLGHDILFGRIGTEIKRQLPTVSPQAMLQRSKQAPSTSAAVAATTAAPAAATATASAAVASAEQPTTAAAGSDAAAVGTAGIPSRRGGRARPAAAMKHLVHPMAGRMRRQHRGPAAASAYKAAAAAYRQRQAAEQQMQAINPAVAAHAAEAELEQRMQQKQHVQHVEQMQHMQHPEVTPQAAEPEMSLEDTIRAPLQRPQGVRPPHSAHAVDFHDPDAGLPHMQDIMHSNLGRAELQGRVEDPSRQAAALSSVDQSPERTGQQAATLSSTSSSSTSSSEPAGKWDSLNFVSQAIDDELEHVPLKAPAAKPHDSTSSMLAADAAPQEQQQQPPAATSAATMAVADDSWRSKVPEPAVNAAPAWFEEVPEPAAKAAALMVLPEPHLTSLPKPSDPSFAATIMSAAAPDVTLPAAADVAVPATAAAAAPTWANSIPEPTASAPTWQAAVAEPGQAKLMVEPEAHLTSTAKAAASEVTAEPGQTATQSASEPVTADTAAAAETAAPWYTQVPEPSDSAPAWQAAVAEPNPAKHAALMAMRGADQAPEEEPAAAPQPMEPATPTAAETWGMLVPEPTATLPTWFAAVPEPRKAGADSTAEEPAAVDAPKVTEPAASQEQEQQEELPAATGAPNPAEQQPTADKPAAVDDAPKTAEQEPAADKPAAEQKPADEPAAADKPTPQPTADKPAAAVDAPKPAEQQQPATADSKPAATGKASPNSKQGEEEEEEEEEEEQEEKDSAKAPLASSTVQMPELQQATAAPSTLPAAHVTSGATPGPQALASKATNRKVGPFAGGRPSAEPVQGPTLFAKLRPNIWKATPGNQQQQQQQQQEPEQEADLASQEPTFTNTPDSGSKAADATMPQAVMYPTAGQPAAAAAADASKVVADSRTPTLPSADPNPAVRLVPKIPISYLQPAAAADSSTPVADVPVGPDGAQPVIPGALKQVPAVAPKDAAAAQPAIPTFGAPAVTEPGKDDAAKTQEPSAVAPSLTTPSNQAPASLALTPSSADKQQPDAADAAPVAKVDPTFAPAVPAAPTAAPAGAGATDPKAADQTAAEGNKKDTPEAVEQVKPKEPEQQQAAEGTDATLQGSAASDHEDSSHHKDSAHHKDTSSKHNGHKVEDKYGHNDPALENLHPKKAHKDKVNKGSKPDKHHPKGGAHDKLEDPHYPESYDAGHNPEHPAFHKGGEYPEHDRKEHKEKHHHKEGDADSTYAQSSRQAQQQAQAQPQRRDPEAELRDSAASAEVDASKPMIVTLGDYVMRQGSFGTGIVTASADASGWVARLAAAYGDNAQVINRGQATATSPEGVEMVRELLKEYPDAGERIKLVVLSFGGNDAITRSGDATGTLAKVAIADYKENIKTMVAELRKAGVANVLLVTPPPAAHRADRKFRKVKEYAKASSEAAKAMNVPTVELFNAVSSLKDWQASAMKADGLRLSERGQQLLFKRVMKVLSMQLPSVSPAKLRPATQ